MFSFFPLLLPDPLKMFSHIGNKVFEPTDYPLRIDSAVHVGYLYRITDVNMPIRIYFAIAALCSNLLLFYVIMLVENRDGFLLIFKTLRILLVTSVIMQVLVGCGIVKIKSTFLK